MGAEGPRGRRIFLDKPAESWTDEDVEEYRIVYGRCVRRYAVFVTGKVDPSPRDVETHIELNVRKLISDIIGPVRAQNEADKARASAQRQLAEDEARRRSEAARQRDLREREAEITARRLAEEKAHAEEQRLQDQAEIDKKAAQEARRQTEAEERRVERAIADAQIAAREREAAENRLAEVRSRVAAQEKSRSDAMARAAAAESSRQAELEREAEREEDLRLSRRCAVSLNQFNKIQLGSSLRDVERAFGCKGTVSSTTKVSGLGVIATYIWEGEVPAANATAIFRNSRLESKSQFGLE